MSAVVRITGWLDIYDEAKEPIEKLIRRFMEEAEAKSLYIDAVDPRNWVFSPGGHAHAGPYLLFGASTGARGHLDFEYQLRTILSLSLKLSGFFYVRNENFDPQQYRIENDVVTVKAGELYDGFDYEYYGVERE